MIEVIAGADTQEIIKEKLLESLEWISVIIHYLCGYINVLRQKHANTFLLNIVQ